jgi:hypothetical protein
MPMGLKIRGCALIIFLLWVLSLYYMIFIDFWPDIGRFWPFLEDLGGKLGFCYPLKVYINHRLLKP